MRRKKYIITFFLIFSSTCFAAKIKSNTQLRSPTASEKRGLMEAIMKADTCVPATVDLEQEGELPDEKNLDNQTFY